MSRRADKPTAFHGAGNRTPWSRRENLIALQEAVLRSLRAAVRAKDAEASDAVP